MALDFHLAEDVREARRNHPALAVEYEIHEKCFSEEILAELRLPLLGRLKDYYADATFSVDELGALGAEIDRLRGSFNDTAARNFLHELLDLIQRAAIDRQSVFALAD